MNRTEIVYVGDRTSLGKEHQRARYTFFQGKPVPVPDDFANILMRSGDFILAAESIKTIDQRFPGAATVLFRRWGAMGDLIMFRATCSAYRRLRPDIKIALRCGSSSAGLFDHDPLWEKVLVNGGMREYPHVASFDQVAEADHRGVEKHRCTLFLERMTSQPISILPEDWKIPTHPGIDEWVNRHVSAFGIDRRTRKLPLVAVQVRGSGAVKTLPPDVMRQILTRLADEYNVILIENSHECAREFSIRDNIFAMPGRDPLHTVSLLRHHADLALVMDSGALWMAHSAPCRTVAILGPTRPAERMSMHPMGQEAVGWVLLNEMINCPACFEAAAACKRKFTCMREQPDWARVVDAVVVEVDRVLEGRPREPQGSVELTIENGARPDSAAGGVARTAQDGGEEGAGGGD